MKILNAASIAEIAKTHGIEPINILEIKWSGSSLWYADKDYDNIPGKILELGAIDSVISKGGKSSQSVNVTLDDSDGSIKQILNNHDIHQVEVIIYQCFGQLLASDRFQIFAGKISSPISWTEGDRTIKFDILSEVEAKEVGFTHNNIDWPLCFGDVLHVPAAKARVAVTGKLEDNMGIVDPLIDWQLSKLEEAYDGQTQIIDFYSKAIEGNQSAAPNLEDALWDYVNVLIDIVAATASAEDIRVNLREHQRIKYHPSERAVKRILARQKLVQLEGGFATVQEQLADLGVQKYLIEQRINIILWRHKQKREAIKRIANCYEALQQIHMTYTKLVDEKCKQQAQVKSSIVITYLEDFTSNDVIINGLRWTGTRSGQVFTFTSPGVPLPRYQNVTVDTWTEPTNDCGVPEALHGLNKFYITDHTKQLKDMYCLVRSKTDGYDHIIKVTEQDEGMCSFELKTQSTGESPTHLIQTPVPFTYGQNSFGSMSLPGVGIIIPGSTNTLIPPPLDTDVARALYNGDVPINPYWPEYTLLALLCKIRLADYNLKQIVISIPGPRSIYTLIGCDIDQIIEVSAVPLSHWYGDNTLVQEMPTGTQWFVQSGTEVYETATFNDIYVANILPSTIKSVMAYRTVDGVRRLTPVPTTYYTSNEAENLGPITVTSLKTKVPLKSITSEQWDDQLYVTLDSSVGPNVVDILQHLIETYTDKTIDAASFAAVKTKQENYPANFALLSRIDVRQLLEEIAWQARCAIYDIDNVFYVRYLSTTPTSNLTLTEADIEFGTMELTSTETEDIITRMDVKWKPDYLPDTKVDPLVLRYNVNRFGLHKQEYDWFIYNNLELVKKSATFWMIRLGNTWKRLTLKTFLTHCNLDCGDAVTLDFASPYVATPDILGEVQRINYDTGSNTIELELWLPVRFGEMSQYQFAYPADLDANVGFPSIIDIQNDYVESDPIISEVTGE